MTARHTTLTTLAVLAVLWAGSAGALCPPGDLNGDCRVNAADVQVLADQWLAEPGYADLNDDGRVDLRDLSALAVDWQQQGVPEYPVISEFMAVNTGAAAGSGQVFDEDYDASDWIEIYNPTERSIDLGSWHLTDDSTDPAKWEFPTGVVLEPGSFLTVFASGKDRRNLNGPLHTNFRLDGDGEYLALLTPFGEAAHAYAPAYPAQVADVSYGVHQYAASIVAVGARVAYRVPSAADAATDWTAIDFDDSGWDNGTTGLGFTAAGARTGRDIGRPSTRGRYTIQGDLHVLQGSGADIWGTADAFYYVYTPLLGDGEITARVVSVTNTNSWAKAGAMIRETLDPGSRHATEVVTPGSGVAFQRRIATNGSSQSNHGNSLSAPYWVRIVREGNTFSGYYSPDGANWTHHGSEIIDMAEDVYVGLCVTSHSDGALCAAAFDHVTGGGDVTSDLKDKMHGVSTSLWARLEFNLEQGQAEVLDRLTLRIKYEDGFVAYLNGQEVARRNAPPLVQWNASAAADRPDRDAQSAESINLLNFLDLLRDGPNVLAIHGLNDDLLDEEFLIVPELVAASNATVGQYFSTPTPGAFNVAGQAGRVGPVEFSHERGFYDAPFQLTLSTQTEGATIIVTLDGSRPTAGNGFPCAQPIPIGRTSTVRAVAIRPGYLDSAVETHTYLFVGHVIGQSPRGEAPGPGWPTSNVNGQQIDYGMDPDVVNDGRYSRFMYDALLAIPSLSLVTDLDHLFDRTTGIYVNAGREGRAWERPTSVELINPDSSEGFQIDAGLRIRGGFSRSNSNPKHAFRLLFRGEYGGSLEFPLFGEEGVDRFENVDLRTSQNYSWAFQNSSQNTLVREVFSRDTQGATGQPYTRSRYCHLYLNGHYWGIYMTQERSEASFAQSYFGGQEDDYDVVKADRSVGRAMWATDGNLDAFHRLHAEALAGFGNYERYYRVQGMNVDGTRHRDYERLLDVENVIDFMIVEYYTGDRDGPGSRFGNRPNNTFGLYNRVRPDGFKWLHHDNEHTLGTGSSEENMVTPFTSAGAQQRYFNPHWLHEQLMASNADYRLKFADHVYRHFFNDGPLTLEAARGRFQRRAEQIETAIIAHSARWGDAKRSSNQSPFTRDSHWTGEINRVLFNGGSRYLTNRVQVVLNQLKSVRWYPDLAPPTFSQPAGYVPSPTILSMAAPSGTVYYTLDGTDPRLPVPLSASGQTLTLLPESTTKRILVPTVANGGNLLANEPAEFEVTYYKSTISVGSLDTAEAVIANPQYQANVVSETSDVINYFNTGGQGHFDNDRPFPGTTMNVDADDFVILVGGMIQIPEGGPWTFGVNSDDGFSLRLETRGRNYASSYPSPRGPGDTLQTFDLLQGGLYRLRLVFYERGGGSELELFAAKGRFSSFDASQFQLVGDLSNGGLQVGEGNQVWFARKFIESSWTSATGTIGYETDTGYGQLIDTDVADVMFGHNSSCYIRIPFTVPESRLANLTLKMRYDDGFIAYLNGGEVARRKFTGTPHWNSAASGQNPDADAIVAEDIDISDYANLMEPGANVLAIHAMNASSDDSDFLISAALTTTEVSQGDIAPAATLYQRPITLTRSTHVKARTFAGQWSPLHEALFAVGPVAESLRISEIMYHPAQTGHPDDPNTEYIELTNIGGQTLDLNLVRFTNGIDFTFPSFELGPGGYGLVVKDLVAFEARYGLGLPVVGQYEGSLANGGERIELEDAAGQTIHNFRFRDGWYDITDGLGFSLTVRDSMAADPNALRDKSAWRPSAAVGGSPGYDDSGDVPEIGAVVVNELLASSAGGEPDWIELHNATDRAIDIGGWFLSDAAGDLTKYEIAPGTSLPAGGYLVFYEDLHFGNEDDPGTRRPFALSSDGETVYLHSGSLGLLGGYSERETFDASEPGVSLGRYRKSTGTYNFVALSEPTPGRENAYPQVGPVVINEIMYNPDGSGDAEYVELLNISDAAVELFDLAQGAPWRFTDDPDDPGIELLFPTDPPPVLVPGTYLVLVKDPTAFGSTYTVPANVTVLAWNDGNLSNGSEKIQLSKPGDADAEGGRSWIRADRVVYSDGTHHDDFPDGRDPWPLSADGGGFSLSRIDPEAYGNDPTNWRSGMPTPGGPN